MIVKRPEPIEPVVFVECRLPWHSRFPGLRVKAVVLRRDPSPPFLGLRGQRFRFNRTTGLTFPVSEGELVSFLMDAVGFSSVPDLGGSIDVRIPPRRPDEIIEIKMRKVGFVLVYGRFKIESIDVVPKSIEAV